MSRMKLGLVALLAVGITGILAAVAGAATPKNTSPPTISGTPKVGSTLTANDGTWANSPTSFTYQWQRCASDGRSCGDITAGTTKISVRNATSIVSASSPPNQAVGLYDEKIMIP